MSFVGGTAPLVPPLTTPKVGFKNLCIHNFELRPIYKSPKNSLIEAPLHRKFKKFTPIILKEILRRNTIQPMIKIIFILFSIPQKIQPSLK